MWTTFMVLLKLENNSSQFNCEKSNCCTKERKSFRFGKTVGWVNDQIFTFGWTISLNINPNWSWYEVENMKPMVKYKSRPKEFYTENFKSCLSGYSFIMSIAIFWQKKNTMPTQLNINSFHLHSFHEPNAAFTEGIVHGSSGSCSWVWSAVLIFWINKGEPQGLYYQEDL